MRCFIALFSFCGEQVILLQGFKPFTISCKYRSKGLLVLTKKNNQRYERNKQRNVAVVIGYLSISEDARKGGHSLSSNLFIFHSKINRLQNPILALPN